MISRILCVFEYGIWEKTKTQKSQNQQKAFYIRKYPLLTDLVTRKRSKETNLLRQNYLDLANEENCFETKFSVCVDNFEQYFGSSPLTVQNDIQNFL